MGYAEVRRPPNIATAVISTMKAVKNENSSTWHLIGDRGCGAEPEGETVGGSWAEIRDTVERDDGSRCTRCRWPP